MPCTTLVCLAADTPLPDVAALVDSRLSAVRLSVGNLVRHFPAVSRWRRTSLLLPHRGLTAGGPVARLDLAAMRSAAHRLYWHRWQLWHSVVAGTPVAKPYWVFLDRHRTRPARYEVARARADYLAQPRIAAMRVFNALPHRPVELPTGHLEALQLGADAYAHLGWLSAVPGQALLCPDGRTLLADGGDRLDSRLSFLERANACLASLAGRDVLVAAVTEPAVVR